MKNEITQKVLEVISNESGIKVDDIFMDSRIEQDLGITGDDIWDIIESLEKEFTIDWCGVDLNYYCYPEGAGLIWSIFNKDKDKSINSYPITVRHLIKVVSSGKWSSPPQVK